MGGIWVFKSNARYKQPQQASFNKSTEPNTKIPSQKMDLKANLETLIKICTNNSSKRQIDHPQDTLRSLEEILGSNSIMYRLLTEQKSVLTSIPDQKKDHSLEHLKVFLMNFLFQKYVFAYFLINSLINYENHHS